jgi:hypothetical protein
MSREEVNSLQNPLDISGAGVGKDEEKASTDVPTTTTQEPTKTSSSDEVLEYVPPVIGPAHRSTFTKVSEGLVGASYAIGLCITGIVIWQLVYYNSKPQTIFWSVAGIMVALSLPLSLHTIHMHLAHFVSPLQRLYLRILWLVPIYGIESWLSLRFMHEAGYIRTLRELYEAFVIHAFFTLMLEFLDKDEENLKKRLIEALGPTAKVCCCNTPLDYWRQGGQLIYRCKFGVFQYVFVRVVISIANLICQYKHCIGHSMYDYSALEPYEVILINSSQCYALWCLGIFYWEVGHRVTWLTGIQPVRKFIVVKAIVFLAWWQSLGIDGLVYVEVIKAYDGYTVEEVAAALQDFLICCEIVFFAIAHHYAFHVDDFKPGGCLYQFAGKHLSTVDAVHMALSIDIMSEGFDHVKRGGGLVHRFKKSNSVLSSEAPVHIAISDNENFESVPEKAASEIPSTAVKGVSDKARVSPSPPLQ